MSKEFELIYQMQIRRLGMELGLIYSEDHGRPILTNGDISVIFCLTNNRFWQGNVIHQNRSPFNKIVYGFQWSTPSIFEYSELRRLACHALRCIDKTVGRKFYPEITLPKATTDVLLRDHQLHLDGNLEITDDWPGFYMWIIDRGIGPFHFCINAFHDALFFQPVKILVKETGSPLRW